MVLFSKFQTLGHSCHDYAHPWTPSCTEASAFIGFHAVFECLRIYTTVYMLALLMRGKIPSVLHIKKTVLGILQSSAFLTSHAFSFILIVCAIRKVLGNFNYLTVSFLPAFISSFISILVERPSRRSLLCLYVANVASETLFRMAVSRGLVRAIPKGEVLIFMASIAALMYSYRGVHNSRDPIYALLRFVVGPYEEKGFTENKEILPAMSKVSCSRNKGAEPLLAKGNTLPASHGHQRQRSVLPYTLLICKIYKNLVRKLKDGGRHPLCPHPSSCVYYSIQGAANLFSVGYSLQVCLTFLLGIKKWIKEPKSLPKIFLSKDSLKLGAFLGGFSGFFRLSSCCLRKLFNGDSPSMGIPAGLVAGLTFWVYPNTTVALYMFWKMLEVMYNAGIEKGQLPKIPGCTIFLYCFFTAVLFHAAVLEPHNLRPSYWKFLVRLSGGRFQDINRDCLVTYGTSNAKLYKSLKPFI
ncbi:transmembrane protein 135-like [Hetaerina americana]|uniref:transmembrane protein 135-like n=1 Tax=Hetaerina americana TaxID=62018 RepID=UPI003A7F2D1B